MIKRILPVAFLGAVILGTIGCQNGSSFKNYKGLSYKVVRQGTGKKPKLGDFVEFQLVAKCDTYHLANSWVDQAGNVPKIPVQETSKPGEWQAIFPLLSAGDSALVEISCDTLLKNMPPNAQQGQLPPWLKKGNKVVLNVSVVSVKSKEEVESEAKDKAAKQIAVDDKTLQDYFAKNNLKPTKTASGLYYTIVKEGSGAAITAGQKVTMSYIGKLLNGTTFDANVDADFHPIKDRQPFTFPVGMHQVIPGWDEGVMLLKKGAKASFYIPSPIAYGPNSPGPTIPANSILIFDVEVTDVQGEEKK